MGESLEKAVVDTGPLITVLTVHFLNATQAEASRRTTISRRVVAKNILEIPAFEEKYLNLFKGIKSLMTTSHVIGELQGLQRSRLKFDGNDLRRFWLLGMEFMRARKIEETLVRLLDMESKQYLRESVCSLGPTDTGLIELARKEGCVLLTDDERTLANQAWEQGIDCQLMKTILA
jgi:rRNA-processing protein FCF1